MTFHNPWLTIPFGEFWDEIYSSLFIDEFDLWIHFILIFMDYDTMLSVCIHNCLSKFCSFCKGITSSNLGALLEWDSIRLILCLTYVWLMALPHCLYGKEQVEDMNFRFTFFDFIFFPRGSRLCYFFSWLTHFFINHNCKPLN